MSGRAIPALPAIAIFAAFFFTLAPLGGAAADTCLTAPNAPAPQGARWYYRTERPAMRKCWRLVGKDQKEIRATRAAQPQPDDDDETAPVAAPQASKQAAPAPETGISEPPVKAPQVTTLVTRNVSNLGEVAPTTLTASADAAAPAQAASAEAPAAPEPPAAAAKPAPPAVTAQAAPNTPPAATYSWTAIFIAGALLALFACAAVLVVMLGRRRTDVLDTIRAREKLAFAPSPEISDDAPDSAPSYMPLPPLVQPVRVDDIDDAMQECARRQRRRAA